MPARSVAVTGIGLISGAGDDAEKCWAAITSGATGIRENTLFDTTEILTDWAGMVTSPQPDDRDRCYSLAITAVREALATSGLDLDTFPRDRTALVVGSSLGAMPTLEQVHRRVVTTGVLDAVPAATSGVPSVADVVAAEFDLRGPRVVLSNACAASSVAIGYAAELLWRGDVDYVVCGGVDPLATLSAFGFTALGALDSEPCSPVSGSSGLTLGEGAAFMVLESAQAARDRGARVLAEVAGYGLTSDGYHQTAPDPGGKGASAAMAEALRTAGLAPQDVDYVNLHGTGTPTNDACEPTALKLLFGADSVPPASSTKSMLGHTLGAAGAVEAVCSVLAIDRGVLPPTINTRGVQDHSGLDIVPDVGRPAKASVVISNSFAFGGNNASVVLTEPRFRPERAVPDFASRDVVVTGAAGLAGSAQDTAALLDALASGRPCFDSVEQAPGVGEVVVGRADTKRLGRSINPARARRMDAMSILSAAAVNDLYARHGKPSRVVAESTGVIFATGYGPISSVQKFHRGVIDSGISGANPLIFPNTVVNAAAGHLAMLNRYRGYNATIANGGTSFVLALQLGARVIARGAAERIMVVAADEFPDLAVATSASLPGYSRDGKVRPHGRTGTVIAEGAVAVLLESREAAAERGAPVLARVAGFGASGDPVGPGRVGTDGAGWSRAIRSALADAGVDGVDTVVSAASGFHVVDDAETRALELAGLGGCGAITPKAVFGETYGCAGGLGLVAALGGRPPLADGQPSQTVLLSSFAYGGSYAAAVLEMAGEAGA